MASDASIRLPDDSPNAGKNVRTRTETISGTLVHTHVFVPAIPVGASDTVVSSANPMPVTGSILADGTIAHDAVDSGNPLKIGARAVAHGTNPTAVAAGDRTDLFANRAGVQFVIGGHPNVIRAEWVFTSAQTNFAILSVSSGTKIVVTAASFFVDADCTVNVACRVGLAASTLPTISNNSATGLTGLILSHPDCPPGCGVVEGTGSGIVAVGGDGEDLIITCDAATGGSLRVVVSYYTIES